MAATSLTTLALAHLRIAQESTSGRSSHTVFGGHDRSLRQTVIAIMGGRGLNDHESPGDATLQVLQGRVLLIEGSHSDEGLPGDILPVPSGRHRLEAVMDSVVLLTVARSS